MQNLLAQSSFAKKSDYDISQRWDTLEHAIHQENFERKTDVDSLTQNLNKKISSNIAFQKTKVELIENNLKTLNQSAIENQSKILDGLNLEKQFQNKCLEENEAFVNKITNGCTSFVQKYDQSSSTKIATLQDKVHKVHEKNKQNLLSVKKNIQDNYINELREFVQTNSEECKKQLESYSNHVSLQINDLRNQMRDYASKKAEGQKKLKFMMENLQEDLNKMIVDEVNQGDITYDCLLKLIEDSCSEIKEARLAKQK